MKQRTRTHPGRVMHDPATSDWLDLMLEEIERKSGESAAALEEAERRRGAAGQEPRTGDGDDQPAGSSA